MIMNPIHEICAEFRQRREELEMPLSEVKRELDAFDSIFRYGAGSSGIAFLDVLRRQGLDADGFLDSDPSKAGTFCEDLPVFSPADGKGLNGTALVIVCINTDGIRYCKSFDEALRIGGHHGVYDKLHGCGYENVIDYTFFRRCFALFRTERYNAPSCSDVDLMLEHEEEMAAVFHSLADEKSKEIFEKIIRFRLLDDTLKIPTELQELQYFEPEFYVSRPEAVFVDCGAYDGISLRTFFRVNEDFKAYYGLEPDPYNFVRLQAYANTFDENRREKMRLFRAAAWDDDEGVSLYALHGPGSFVANDIGTVPTCTARIDDLLNGVPATLIKMNIEGSEKQALHGAEQTIRCCKPALAIAGYHRTDDLWAVPLMILQYRRDYLLYLRSYMNHMSFVYYAK